MPKNSTISPALKTPTIDSATEVAPVAMPHGLRNLPSTSTRSMFCRIEVWSAKLASCLVSVVAPAAMARASWAICWVSVGPAVENTSTKNRAVASTTAASIMSRGSLVSSASALLAP